MLAQVKCECGRWVPVDCYSTPPRRVRCACRRNVSGECIGVRLVTWKPRLALLNDAEATAERLTRPAPEGGSDG